MGGQACVLYGASEFTRNIDLALILDNANQQLFNKFLLELKAKIIAIPNFDIKFLEKGHALHFRSEHDETKGLRIDIMSKMRGVDSFDILWSRRLTIELLDGVLVNLISLPDLVLAKKTQRDKDWPMIRRLLEADYFSQSTQNQSPDKVNIEKVKFWFKEIRTPSILIKLCEVHPILAKEFSSNREVINTSIKKDVRGIELGLTQEEELERKLDREYWAPLKAELEKLRHLKQVIK